MRATCFPRLAGSPLALKLLAVGVGVVTLLALYRGIKTIERVSVLLGAVAVLTLLSVAGAAFMHWSAHLAFTVAPHDSFWAGLRAGLGSALIIAMYDYLGYNAANTIADEVVAPARTLPRAIGIAVTLVAVLYIAMQTGVLGAIPWQQVVPLADGSLPPLGQHLASAIVERVLGVPAAIGITLLILITAFASVYGNLLGASRIPYAAAQDGIFLRPFAHVHGRHRFPDVSLVVIGWDRIGRLLFYARSGDQRAYHWDRAGAIGRADHRALCHAGARRARPIPHVDVSCARADCARRVDLYFLFRGNVAHYLWCRQSYGGCLRLLRRRGTLVSPVLKTENRSCQRSPYAMGLNSITRIGEKVSRSSLAMVGRSMRMRGKIKCSFCHPRAIDASRTTAAATAVRANHLTATTWTRTPTT